MTAKKSNGRNAGHAAPAKDQTNNARDSIASGACLASAGAAFRAKPSKCMDYPSAPRYSTDSSLPEHLLKAAQQAIERVEEAEALRFATLQAQFATLGHTLHQSGPGDGPGPVSYLAERWGMARHVPTLDDVEKFLAQIGGAQ
jgi:hypothetical protein